MKKLIFCMSLTFIIFGCDSTVTLEEITETKSFEKNEDPLEEQKEKIREIDPKLYSILFEDSLDKPVRAETRYGDFGSEAVACFPSEDGEICNYITICTYSEAICVVVYDVADVFKSESEERYIAFASEELNYSIYKGTIVMGDDCDNFCFQLINGKKIR